MTTQMQAVTERYVSNLIHNGRNKEFDIEHVQIHKSYASGVDNELVGFYYTAHITRLEASYVGAGATIQQSVRRALEKHGVTFR